MGAVYLGLDATGWGRMTSTWWEKVSLYQLIYSFDLHT